MKHITIVYGGLNINRVYGAIEEVNTSLINQPMNIEFDDSLDEDGLKEEIYEYCKNKFVELSNNKTKSLVANSHTEPRACAFIYDDYGELLYAYEMDNLLYFKGPDVKKYDKSELRKELDITSGKTSGYSKCEQAGLAVATITGLVFLGLAIYNKLQLNAVNSETSDMLVYEAADIIARDRFTPVCIGLGGLYLSPAIAVAIKNWLNNLRNKSNQKKKVK